MTKNMIEAVQRPPARPERILQFGEGNFLRAFADWMIDKANRQGEYDGGVVLCQPIAQGMGEVLNRQKGMYTLVMRGMENGAPVEKVETITAVQRCINPYEQYEALMEIAHSPQLQVMISNTTEAGIAYHAGDKLEDRPPVSFPAKVCAFLYERYRFFQGASEKGLLFLPVELIDNNGANLKRIVLQYAQEWGLEESFLRWVEQDNAFCSTLVDRIVTGYPRDEVDYFEEKLGYQDNALVTSELFNLWVIEGKKEWAERLPIHKTDAHVLWTDDVTPYKKRKVRILNGAHTSSVLAAFLSGHDTVLEMMNDPIYANYLKRLLHEEVIPTLDLPRNELEDFAAAVMERFRNPYIKHRLLDISLNSCSKWCARVMPSLLAYVEQMGALPKRLAFSLAAFIKFYQGQWQEGAYEGKRANGEPYTIRDDAQVLDFFASVWRDGTAQSVAAAVLKHTEFWDGQDLSAVPGLQQAVAEQLERMDTMPMAEVVAQLERE